MRSLFRKPMHMSLWNHRIRMTYWCLTVILILSMLVLLPFVKQYYPDYLDTYMKNQIYWQFGFLISMMVIGEWLYKKITVIQDYLVITIGAGFSTVVLFFNYSESFGLLIALILPIVASILHFNYAKVLYASLVTLVPFVTIMPFDHYELLEMPIRTTMIGVCIIVCATVATLGIVNRGLKLIADEKEALVNERNHRLQQLAIQEAYCKDSLTGLDNHKRFQERLRCVLDDEQAAPIHLAVIDIDNFKSINDTFGHSNGDLVLRRVGALLKAHESKCVHPSRYGGEEFTIIFKGLAFQAVADALEDVRSQTERLLFPELDGRTITVSIGCHAAEDEKDASTLFRIADTALYQAKRNGKNRVQYSDFFKKEGGVQR
ncbi:GGDEF domain-containing protein [Paenibacillus soyae]|uniref:GGDEF domain-containing protein n=1 Tax=Paenibacillus soyae TaxID=2969249 RepID=A0A9X2SBZ4_9BACL|nr:GGDEF domain-containing protein [Paenibacillus soyae]MCR2806168.1 GGDEF domain-containing protein [Paenibacillus soyae]